jgi:hypothetical protein
MLREEDLIFKVSLGYTVRLCIKQNETTLPPINPKKIELSIFLYNFLYLQSTSSKFVILYTGTTLLILIIRSGNGYPKGTLGASIWKRNG